MAKKKSNDRDKKTSIPARSTPSPSRPAASSSPSRSAAQSASQASQARAFQEAKARSEQVQRQIESVRNRTEHTLSRTPAALRDQVIDTVTQIEVTKSPQQIGRKRLRDAAKKQARTHQLGALTDNKPARETRRSPEKVRAIIKCKSRPKTKKSTRRGGGGGGKRFIPWC